jgi:type I restriction enzyme S subunit
VIAGAGQGKTRGQTSLLFIDTYINQSVIALEPDPSSTSEAFLFFDMQRRYEQFRQLSDAHSSRGSLTSKLLADIAVVIPSPKIVKAFQLTVAPMLDTIKNNLRENTQLINSRDALLSTLMRHDSATGVLK